MGKEHVVSACPALQEVGGAAGLQLAWWIYPPKLAQGASRPFGGMEATKAGILAPDSLGDSLAGSQQGWPHFQDW